MKRRTFLVTGASKGIGLARSDPDFANGEGLGTHREHHQFSDTRHGKPHCVRRGEGGSCELYANVGA